MTLQLASRLDRVKPSATLAVSQRAAELRAQGRDIIGLGTGEPDFDTPDHITQAAIRAIEAGDTKYTAVDGTAALKDAIIGKLARDNGLHYDPREIIVSNGAKHSIFNLLLALVEEGSEVLVPAPYWVSYPDMAALAGATPVVLRTTSEQQFRLTAEQLEAAITPRTRLLVLNAPSNPTGQIYRPSDLAALAEVLARHPQVLVVSDEIYEHIYWGDEQLQGLLQAAPQLRERTIVVNGVSKAYAMTGWRIGYAAGPAPLIAAMRKIQGQSTSNPSSISQAAAVAALNGPQDCVAAMARVFRQRHDYVVAALNALPGVHCLEADGAFYAFPSFAALIDRMDGVADDTALAQVLLDEAGVALVPGTAFGMPGHLRLSFATSMENLEGAMARLERFARGVMS